MALIGHIFRLYTYTYIHHPQARFFVFDDLHDRPLLTPAAWYRIHMSSGLIVNFRIFSIFIGS